MDNKEPANEKELTNSQAEVNQDGELSEEELDSVDGGLLPAVQKNPATKVTNMKPVQNGIIAILIG